MSEHIRWMQHAIKLAQLAEGCTSPNPMVGAVIVRDGQVLGEGYHHRAGMPHAEIEALRAAKGPVQGATLYVTLEPCNHYGRTPPCTDAIIASGIAHVVYAIPDPYPPAGGGAQRLRDAGLQVTNGICADEAADLNRFFLHHCNTKLPYVIARYASSLDGKIATRNGDSQWITGEASRRRSHQLRHAADAILIGAGTAIVDNPRLTTRLPMDDPRHPLRIVLDSRGRVPLENQVFSSDLAGRTLVATTDAMPTDHEKKLASCGVEVLRLPQNGWGRVDITALLHTLGQREIQSLVVEGGSTILGSFFDSELVDEVWAFIAPVIIGGKDAPSPVEGIGVTALERALRLKDACIELLDGDWLISGKARLTAKEQRCLPES
ncbi:MAG: bifunctional diaminohydroxyphosphoribosylaminopyrimidine deaminase/5-amino-6-(5-phosphoribosylamino)uracil reductase RibD [Anaerolineae bacterium]|nr:bifunctional diaminohydroxyphosphoribosylaminopyrimidine deaminase/5-amino-6-(5-phosphoribosylamino)uracil reductase RibD [Anaerolineae bacterium]